MTSVSDMFWHSSLEEMKQGYIYSEQSEEFICLICGMTLLNGIIYPYEGQLYEAKKFIRVHIEQSHRSSFHFLLDLDKKLTGLTDHQKTILELFYEGYDDNKVAKVLNTGSTSTIRNHRFTLREKQKQAKIFLAIMELLGEQAPKKGSFINIPRNTKKVDDRFAITEEEYNKILSAYFPQGPDGPISSFPLKEKKRVAILKHILKCFETDRTYTEKEVNDVLKQFYNDYVLLRRNLIEYGFMERIPDGSSYWVKL